MTPFLSHQNKKWSGPIAWALLIAVVLALSANTAWAHQPFFEKGDLTATTPMQIANPTISTALYATLDRDDDVDYFRFDGVAGTSIELGMTIPQIQGQETFAPVIALIGPGLPVADVASLPADPARGSISAGDGLYILHPVEATAFYEPFSRTNYWRRQRETVVLPSAGTYTLLVWSDAGQTGRYVLVVGDREVLGGDPLFALKISSFWTPVSDPTSPPATVSESTPAAAGQCSWLARLLSRFSSQVTRC